MYPFRSANLLTDLGCSETTTAAGWVPAGHDAADKFKRVQGCTDRPRYLYGAYQSALTFFKLRTGPSKSPPPPRDLPTSALRTMLEVVGNYSR